MIELLLRPRADAAEGDYQPRKWPIGPTTINQWGGPPPLRFLLTGFPIAPPDPGRPAWAMAPTARPEPSHDDHGASCDER